MIIPQQFVEILRHDTRAWAGVEMTFANLEPWLRSSGTVFFPEYTDHGPKHVDETLLTASSLIRDDTWEVLTPADIGCLCLSILLHDAAIHLTEDGFLSLVSHDVSPPHADELDDKGWKSLWRDFLAEASRFDGRQLVLLFGDPEPAHTPPNDPSRWTLRDRLLIGEFIRRHHARLAHEIAMVGVPGVTAGRFGLCEVAGDVAEIVGLIARSHNVPLRSMFESLRRFDLREYKGIHAVFLMVAVRISDYFQVASDRAPQQLLQVRRLRSPVSRREWAVHEAVEDIRLTHEDPEAVYIHARPANIEIYVRLKDLLKDIQGELDASWATLGEVYGRFPKLAHLGLTVRRVRSNLDDPQRFAATVDYLPVHATFTTAEADLLRLLISPLYGERPEIGVREILQNAMDACRELTDYVAHSGDAQPPSLTDQNADVCVTFVSDGSGTGTVTVSDRGIGMTAGVLQKYFLRAGASYRRSDAWKLRHQDDIGRSRVLRSGRFGIGALAAFLLGDEIEVSTRHVTAEPRDGIEFLAGIDTGSIELKRKARPVGTTITIRITDPKIWNSLIGKEAREDVYLNRKWDWYCLDTPTVSRVIVRGETKTPLGQRFVLPGADERLPVGGHRIGTEDYADVQWTYSLNWPALTCNGLIIAEGFHQGEIQPAALWEAEGQTLICPRVSVFDPDGHFPLVLQRTGLTSNKYPFHDQLRAEVIKDLLAFLLVNAPPSPVTAPGGYEAFRTLQYPGFRTQYPWSRPRWRAFFATAGGLSLADAWHFAQIDRSRILALPRLPEGFPSELRRDANLADVIVPFDHDVGVQDERAWFRAVLGGYWRSDHGPFQRLRTRGQRLLLRQAAYEDARRPGIVAKWLIENVKVDWSSDGWVLLKSGECPDGGIDFKALADGGNFGKAEGWAELYDCEMAVAEETSPIATAWREILGQISIPYNLDERRISLGKPYKALEEYVSAHVALQKRPAAQREPS